MQQKWDCLIPILRGNAIAITAIQGYFVAILRDGIGYHLHALAIITITTITAIPTISLNPFLIILIVFSPKSYQFSWRIY